MSSSNYYKLPLIDGLEALDAVNYNTPFPFHFHPTYNISLVYDGTFETKLSDKSVSAVKGTILVTNPHEIHANPCLKADARSFFTFYLTADFFEYANNLKNLQFKQKVIYDDSIFAQLHQVSLKIKAGYSGNNYEKELTHALKTLAAKHGTTADETGHEKITALFDNYLNETHFEKFSLQDAADQLGLDKFKFLRLFKFQTGLTPNNYLILKKIEKSKIMLAEGSNLLGVAIDLGFYDTAHFCKHFKKFTGTSPIAYRSSI
ncbi:MAG: AraC family transcriptional regulator [Mucilaginibacter sp.]